MVTITKSFDFCSSHTLVNPAWDEAKNRAVFGKCSRLHGHNYRLEVEVSGPVDPDSGMIMNTRDISSLVQELVINEIDHRDLNRDVPWLSGTLPTAEVIVHAIWERLAPVLSKQEGVELYQLRLWETPEIYAVRRKGN